MHSRFEANFGLRWTRRALSDPEFIGNYIARDNAAAAERHLARLLESAETAARLPLAGRRVLTVFEGHRLLPRLPK